MKERSRNSSQSTVNRPRPAVDRLVLTILLIIASALALQNCSTNKSTEAETYTCPMHPTVISDKQGSCPVCGMDLVRKARAGEEVQITEDLNKLLPSTNEAVVSAIKTIKGEFRSMPITLAVQGIVTYDSRTQYSIPSKTGGRLEKVYLKYAFQKVVQGQKIAEIYSPELLTAQRELLYLIENDRKNSFLIESAKSKLELLGLTTRQTEDLIKNKEVSSVISVYSPYDGYVIPEDQPSFTPSSLVPSSMNEGMNSVPLKANVTASNTDSPAALVRQGDYVATGQLLFKIVNTSSLRIELNLPLSIARSIKENEKVDLDFGNNTIEKAQVDFVQPFLNDGQEFVKIRLYTTKTNDLQIGQLIQATIHLKPGEGLWIPSAAILDEGLNQIVFVKDRGILKPKKIETHASANGWTQVKGLASSDEIAADAHYLVDSEDFIKTKN
jgi:Cu(I)/Ag(I) efflux system membrane fusion protein